MDIQKWLHQAETRVTKYIKPVYQWLMSGEREHAILRIAVIELFFLIGVCQLISWDNGFFKIHGIATLIALLVSAPVAFVIWHFRDANTQQQIANQRKDVNLKEFQKIAEWVSGAHLVEEKITEKNKATKKGSEQESSEQETACEYSRQPEKQNITTFSKQDGAVGLQIAAIYMLLPFYRGDHGEDFRRPAFNLLTAAWLSLFSKVEDIEIGRELAKQPLAVAITEVLFADGGLVYSTEENHKHLLVNLYLPFINLTLSGLGKDALYVFAGKNCQGIDLHGAILQEVHFEKADFEKANLKEANLEWAYFEKTDLTEAQLEKANLEWAHFEKANLKKADLKEACLEGAHFERANLKEADLKGADLYMTDLKEADLEDADLRWTNLTMTDLRKAQLKGVDLKEVDLNMAYLEEANLFGAQLTESDFNQLLMSISQTQKADLIILALVEPPISIKTRRLIATKRKTETSTRQIGKKVEHIISGYQLNEQKTKELNKDNWDIEIKKNAI